MKNLYHSIARFFSGARFPAFMLLAMLFYQIFLAITIFAPIGDGLWGRFMTDFRVWCFGYDPNSGQMQWTAAWIMLTEPLLLQAAILVLWRTSLMDMVRSRRREIVPPLSAAFATVALIAASLIWMSIADAAAADKIPPFPGERIRTALIPPEIDLINQKGDLVRLSDLRGEVVLLTAIYSTCATACPMIMFQAKRTLESLTEEEQAGVTVMAISLAPERDSLELMAEAAVAYRMDAPQFHFLNGDSAKVNRILDGLSVARLANEKTGEIDHANMYFLIDRQGRIAFRFNLSDRHQTWLKEALELLLAEDRELRA